MRKRTSKMYSLVEEIRELSTQVPSKSELLRRIGYSPQNAGNHRTLRNVADEYGIVLPDGTGTSVAIAKNKTPLQELLVEDGRMSSYHLKRRLLREGVLEPRCSAPYCPVPNPSVNPWTGEPVELKLSLDHVDGNPRNNRLDNLRLLCYHCHGLTPTFCNGKGRGR